MNLSTREVTFDYLSLGHAGARNFKLVFPEMCFLNMEIVPL